MTYQTNLIYYSIYNCSILNTGYIQYYNCPNILFLSIPQQLNNITKLYLQPETQLNNITKLYFLLSFLTYHLALQVLQIYQLVYLYIKKSIKIKLSINQSLLNVYTNFNISNLTYTRPIIFHYILLNNHYCSTTLLIGH